MKRYKKLSVSFNVWENKNNSVCYCIPEFYKNIWHFLNKTAVSKTPSVSRNQSLIVGFCSLQFCEHFPSFCNTPRSINKSEPNTFRKHFCIFWFTIIFFCDRWNICWTAKWQLLSQTFLFNVILLLMPFKIVLFNDKYLKVQSMTYILIYTNLKVQTHLHQKAEREIKLRRFKISFTLVTLFG